MSEAAVKRMFSERNFSLRRLDEFCDVLGIDYSDLVRTAEYTREVPKSFSPEVEEALADDPKLILALYYLFQETPVSKIQKQMKLDKVAFYKIARELESLGLVEVGVGDRIKVKARKSTRWSPTGPLAARYTHGILEEFFATDFKASQEHQDFLTGVLSAESYGILKRKIVDLFQQFEALSDLDSKLSHDNSEVFWLYTGIRPWAPVNVIERTVSRRRKQ